MSGEDVLAARGRLSRTVLVGDGVGGGGGGGASPSLGTVRTQAAAGGGAALPGSTVESKLADFFADISKMEEDAETDVNAAAGAGASGDGDGDGDGAGAAAAASVGVANAAPTNGDASDDNRASSHVALQPEGAADTAALATGVPAELADDAESLQPAANGDARASSAGPTPTLDDVDFIGPCARDVRDDCTWMEEGRRGGGCSLFPAHPFTRSPQCVLLHCMCF